MTILPMDVVMGCLGTLAPFHHLSPPDLRKHLTCQGLIPFPWPLCSQVCFGPPQQVLGFSSRQPPQPKPQGGVGGLTNANALASRGDLSGDEALGVLGGGLNGLVLVV